MEGNITWPEIIELLFATFPRQKNNAQNLTMKAKKDLLHIQTNTEPRRRNAILQ